MMTGHQANVGILASAALAAAPAFAATQELKPNELPPPRAEGGMPLTNALKLRHSTREYSDQPLPAQTLSDLLWAAFGINRPSGDRTAPYWRHVMVIDTVAMADGVWTYEPKAHGLLPYLLRDIRAATGVQDFFGTAPLNLVYVAHGERMTDIPPEERRLFASVDTGFIGQNVYLVLRLGRPCNGLPGSGRLSEAYPHIEAAGPAVRDLYADCRVSARLNAKRPTRQR